MCRDLQICGIHERKISMNFGALTIKAGKKTCISQLPLSKYKQFSSNINDEMIVILMKIDSWEQKIGKYSGK